MRIGEVADELGINTETIRCYGSIELIPAAPRTQAGYRDYADGDVDRLEFIRAGRRLRAHGVLSPDEVRQVFQLRERGERPCDCVLDTVHHRSRDIDRRSANWSGSATSCAVCSTRPNSPSGHRTTRTSTAAGS